MTTSVSMNDKRIVSVQAVGTGVLCAFFVSGMCGLIHEIAWTRLLRHIMGNTTFSITTVLCAFMGGLALGSYVGGRIIDRRNDPLRVFAILEGAIAAYCLLLPWFIDSTQPIYRFVYQNTHTTFYVFSLIRFLFCGLLLLVPATLMGATLPVLTRFFVRSVDQVGRSVGVLYGVNTFGAVVGVGMTGFLFIPNLGVTKTIYLACVFNAAVAVTAYMLHRRTLAWPQGGLPPFKTDRHPEGKTQGETGAKPVVAGSVRYGKAALFALLVGYGFSGASALVYEIAWTRVVSLLVGSSVYAFSMILVAFILGLAMGSTCFAKLADRVRDPMRGLAIMEVIIGLSALLVVPFFGKLPFFVTGLIARLGGSFWLLHLAEFILILLIMLVPTLLMGAAFPLASRLFLQSSMAVGRTVGTVYAYNTLGSIAGSFLGGFMLIPWLGIQNTILAAVLVNIIIGCVFFGLSHSLKPAQRALVVAVVAVVVCTGIAWTPPWDPARMSIGPFIQGRRLPARIATSTANLERYFEADSVIFYKEGLTTTITIREDRKGDLFLWVNGKPDASSSVDMPTQVLSAHVPLLLHPNPRNVLVIGLASGITLGSAGRYPLETLDCVEISPAMVDACRYFDAHNYSILDDPRVHLIIADGRNHVALTAKKYDVISSEPSNPWIAGIGDLFTREYFELCYERLNPEGIACTWIAAYNIDKDAFRSVVHAFQSVFQDVSVWNPTDTDFLLIGSKGKLAVDHQDLARRMAEDAVAADLKRIGVDTVPDLLGHMVMGDNGAARLAQGAPIHTDDNALLEFGAPRSMTNPKAALSLLSAVERHREVDLSFLTSPEHDAAALAAVKAECARSITARGRAFRAKLFPK